MAKALIVVDMQNDFVTGTLANKDAKAIVKPIADYIRQKRPDYDLIVFTRDTHYWNYLSTNEGMHLPVEHCILDTPGWCIVDEIDKAARDVGAAARVNKDSFGYIDWVNKLKSLRGINENYPLDIDDITLVGTCTSICVASNAIILKALLPEAKISVIASLCADIDKESHKAALLVMKNQQINIK